MTTAAAATETVIMCVFVVYSCRAQHSDKKSKMEIEQTKLEGGRGRARMRKKIKSKPTLIAATSCGIQKKKLNRKTVRQNRSACNGIAYIIKICGSVRVVPNGPIKYTNSICSSGDTSAHGEKVSFRVQFYIIFRQMRPNHKNHHFSSCSWNWVRNMTLFSILNFCTCLVFGMIRSDCSGFTETAYYMKIEKYSTIRYKFLQLGFHSIRYYLSTFYLDAEHALLVPY